MAPVSSSRKIDRFRLRIAHRIVVPRREPVRLAVAAPGATQAAFADHRAELGLAITFTHGDGRVAARLQIDRVFAAVRRESAEPVEVRQFEERQRQRDGCSCALPDRHERRRRSRFRWRRESCCCSEPRLPLSTTLAAARNRLRWSSGMAFQSRRKTPPGLSMPASVEWASICRCSC